MEAMQPLLLSLAAKALPILALVFVFALYLHKLYISVRSHYDIKVNCWFCNENTRVKYNERNSWMCPQCEQYNGFNKDGDYNRDVLLQRDVSARNSKHNSSHGSSSAGSAGTYCANAFYSGELAATTAPQPSDGLCHQCNEAQRLKVEKLAQFEPKHESRFDQELKKYQAQLEQQFRLCGSCERHVNKVLHEKKKMVLGSKFLNFVMKGAALLKQPHFNRLARVQQQRRLQRLQRLMTLLTFLNVLCLLCNLPLATRAQFNCLLGETLALPLYFIYSHALTLFRLPADYVGSLLSEQAATAKMLLFGRTFGKLVLYSVGLNQLQAQQATFSSCYTSLYPYVMLALSFIHNISDGLKFTRFTLLLVLWSVYAQGTLLLAMDGVTFILLGSLLTLILLISSKSNHLLLLAHNESVGDSFHRLCADECISDDETISLLSQQLSCSSNNNSHNMSLPSPSCSGSQLRKRYTHSFVSGHVAPSVLSLDSLRLSSQHTPVVNGLATAASTYRSQSPLYATSSLDQQAWLAQMRAGMQPYQTRSMQFPLEQQQPQQLPAQHIPMGLQQQQQQQRSLTRSSNNLLFPSRLHMQQQQLRNGEISAWVDATSGSQHPDIFNEASTANLMRCCNTDKQLSRTSSQSSGFESHPGNNPNRQEAPQAQPFRSLSQQQTLPQTLPQPQLLQHLPNSAMSDYDWVLVRPPPSPYSTQSEFQTGWSLPPRAEQNPDIRPGDLLRKWMDRNGSAKQNSN